MRWSQSTADMRWKRSQTTNYAAVTPPNSAPIVGDSLKIHDKLTRNVFFRRTKETLDFTGKPQGINSPKVLVSDSYGIWPG